MTKRASVVPPSGLSQTFETPGIEQVIFCVVSPLASGEIL